MGKYMCAWIYIKTHRVWSSKNVQHQFCLLGMPRPFCLSIQMPSNAISRWSNQKQRIRFHPKHDSLLHPKTKLVAQSTPGPTKPRHQRRRGRGGGRAHPRSPRRHIQLLEQAKQTIRPCYSSISQGPVASSGQSHFCQVHCEILDPGVPKCNLTKENFKDTRFVHVRF